MLSTHRCKPNMTDVNLCQRFYTPECCGLLTIITVAVHIFFPTTLTSYPAPRRCKIDEEVTHKAWLNRSNILFAGTDKWSLDSRVSLLNSNDSDFSIQIERVAVADEGPYTCSFQARNQPRIAHVYLIVQGEDAVSGFCLLVWFKVIVDTVLPVVWYCEDSQSRLNMDCVSLHCPGNRERGRCWSGKGKGGI